jgi:signal peptidase II
VRDLQAARRAPLNPATPAGAGGPGPDGALPDDGAQPAEPVQGSETGAHGVLESTTEHRPRLWPLFGSVALVGLALDVVTKVSVVTYLDPGVGVRVLGPLLTLRLIRNPGAAFSQGEGFAWVFAVAAVLVLAFVLVRLVPRLGHVGWAVALGLLVAGVSGNLADRIFRAPGPFRGHVVDFLQLPHWPIFNVADMCITTAAIMIVVLSLLKNVGLDGGRPGDQDTSAATAPDRPASA